MKYGLYMPNFGAFGTARVVADLARNAENAGWDGLFLWDHIARPYVMNVVDPCVALTAAAMTTQTIKLGAMVTPIPRRRPWKLARETASLDHLSGGRLIFGAGLGSGREQEWQNLGEELDAKVRGMMLDEGLDILAGLWSGQPFEYEGAYHTVVETQFEPAALQTPRIPVWIAGNYPNKAPLRRAARWDGVFPVLKTEDFDSDAQVRQLKEVVDLVREYRADDSPFDVVHRGIPTPGDDKARAVEIVAPFMDTGMTWWLENLSPWCFGMEWDSDWDLAIMRERVLQGPPKE